MRDKRKQPAGGKYHGNAKAGWFRFSLTTGTLVNLILDPILIFGCFGAPALGMRGAAIATVAAQFSAALVAFAFNLAVNKEIRFHFRMLKPHWAVMRRIWNVGFPAALQQSVSPMMIFAMNQILLGFTPAAPAVYVIYVRLQSTVLIPGAFFQALGNSQKTLVTSISQLVLMLTAAVILAHIGSVYTVWYAFDITEALVAALAIFFMRKVVSKTLGPASRSG